MGGGTFWQEEAPATVKVEIAGERLEFDFPLVALPSQPCVALRPRRRLTAKRMRAQCPPA